MKPYPFRGRGGPPPPPRFLRGQPELPAGSETWRTPWVQLRTFNFSPTLYPAMLNAVSPDARAGDLVTVYDKDGNCFGAGLYNPKARVPLRVIHHGREPVGEDLFEKALRRAVQLRREWMKLDAVTDAYRVVNSDGDCLSGLMVDRYADVLSVEVHSLGVYQRLPAWLQLLHEALGTRREWVQVDERIARLEGISQRRAPAPPPRKVRIREHGVRFEVDFAEGHKTGFFCDQRENRFRLSQFVKDQRVLDLCCYTGGFAVTAATLGGAGEVTGVDLDETAIAQARHNGNLNQQSRIRWVHADAFAFARQMQKNGEKWDAVVADPPKLIGSREEEFDGWHKYEDLNSLAIALVKPGGLFVTCSCSGLVSLPDFERMAIRSAHRMDRRLQFLDCTGAGPDHPILSNCLESRYLKVLWARVI